MELILISNTKLKIMLTADDMESYELTEGGLTYENKETRVLFDRLLEEARSKLGFDSRASRLFIQVYTSKSGGCEVYVTKTAPETVAEKGGNDTKGGEGCPPKEKAPRKKREYCVYRFAAMEQIIDACRALSERGYESDSALYYCTSPEGGYYLVLREDIPQTPQSKKRKYVCKSDVANEFGRRIGGKEVLPYLHEHCAPIAVENAVELMREM
jgi:negative regulator of genetic competence, sporulation and motility